LAEGWDAIGFDIERHRYPARALPESGAVKTGGHWNNSDPEYKPMGFNVENAKRLKAAPLTGGWCEYPGHLILKSILELNGYDLRHSVNPALIVASPPCQEFSYMAQPWKRGKRIAAGLRLPSSDLSAQELLWEEHGQQITDAMCGHGTFPDGYKGSRTLAELTALYRACFRIARECGCPIVLENVKGAQPWVGKAQANFGSYYLWGDIANVGGRVVRPDRVAFGMPAVKAAGRGTKHGGDCFNDPAWPGKQGGITKTAAALKVPGMNFHEYEKTGQPGRSFQSAAVEHTNAADRLVALTAQRTEEVGMKGTGGGWFEKPYRERGDITGQFNSKSPARKAASAMIAEIPYELAAHIARVFKP
jgi:hypothetical protein